MRESGPESADPENPSAILGTGAVTAGASLPEQGHGAQAGVGMKLLSSDHEVVASQGSGPPLPAM